MLSTDLQKKIDTALRLIDSAALAAKRQGSPLELAYSSGKDSDVILELARMSGVEFTAIYKNTTIDPPYSIRHAIENGVEVRRPSLSFLDLIRLKGLPSRRVRFCCEVLKEYHIYDHVIMGIRAEESRARSNRYIEPTFCRTYGKDEHAEVFLPILQWTGSDVEQFISSRGITCHPLYYDDKGNFHVERRLGCLGCPLASRKNRINAFKHYPRMVRAIIRNLTIRLQRRREKSSPEKHYQLDDPFDIFVFWLFTDSVSEFRSKFSTSFLPEYNNSRLFLESYFNISLDNLI